MRIKSFATNYTNFHEIAEYNKKYAQSKLVKISVIRGKKHFNSVKSVAKKSR